MRVVKAIYGSDGGLSSVSMCGYWSGPWNNLICMLSNLQDWGIDLLSLCLIRVGDETSTNFWHDKLLANMSLVVSFHRIFPLDNHKSDFY